MIIIKVICFVISCTSFNVMIRVYMYIFGYYVFYVNVTSYAMIKYIYIKEIIIWSNKFPILSVSLIIRSEIHEV